MISQTPMHMGPLAAYGSAELDRLSMQRRVFSRLDWWTLSEWLHSDAFLAASSAGIVDAALLVVPVSFEDINRLRSARSTVAWLRWCAVADGVPASGALRELFAYCAERCREAGLGQLFCIIETASWLLNYLREAGFVHVDDVVTMASTAPFDIPALPTQEEGFGIREAREADLDQVGAVDASAFEEQWRYPDFVLQRALRTAGYFSVAAQDGQVVGYQFAACYGDEAHITRLAVRSDLQGRGVGARLLADVLLRLWQDFGVTTITLNTQAANEVSQHLYSRFGFEAVQPDLRVMRKRYD
jgi:ribosomal-protein-alanine N-acetyltransferase